MIGTKAIAILIAIGVGLFDELFEFGALGPDFLEPRRNDDERLHALGDPLVHDR